VVLEAAQFASLGQDGERQDRADARSLLQAPEIGVVLEMESSSVFELLA